MTTTFGIRQRMRKVVRLIGVVFGVFLFSLGLVTVARSASLSPQARPAAKPADMIVDCTGIAQDESSLQQAIACANLAGSGSYTIEVTADILLTQPASPITNSVIERLTIVGHQHTIDAQGHGRVLDVQSVKQLAVRDLTLQGGNVMTATAGIVPDWGGGLRYYCGEGQSCTGVLTNVTLRNNQAGEGGGFALYCYADTTCSATLIDSTLYSNRAQWGGAITTGFDETNRDYAVHLVNSSVIDNRATLGGGIFVRGATVTASNSTIRDNQATTGGGLALVSGEYYIHVNLQGSTLSNNSATTQGGGIYVRSSDPGDVDLVVTNSTLSGNQVTDSAGLGGAIAISSTYGTGIALRNVTLVNNSAHSGGGIYNAVDDDSFAPAGLVSFGNSIIADNQTGGNCAGVLMADHGKGVQLFTSVGHNLDSDGACLTPAVRQPSDILNGDANLGLLMDNGGPTPTRALLAGSQAIDAGDDAMCAAAPVNGLDQRGVARPQGAHCDMGAYERPDVAACTYPDLTAGDEAALRQAIDCLNVAPAGAYTLTIAADIGYTTPMFPLINPWITHLQIAGNGHTLNAQGHGRVLTITPQHGADYVTDWQNHFAVSALSLTGGNSAESGGGLVLHCDDHSVCTLTMADATITRNQAGSGGGVRFTCDWASRCHFTLRNTEISENLALESGGGLTSGVDEDAFEHTITLIDSVVRNNRALSADDGGGGIRQGGGALTLINSTIDGNTATRGGGLMLTGGYILKANVYNSTISNNRADLSGGGAYIYARTDGAGVTLTLANSTVSGNQVTSATGIGGALSLRESGFGDLAVHLRNSTIANNHASQGSAIYAIDFVDSFDPVAPNRGSMSNSIILGDPGSPICTRTINPDTPASLFASNGHNLDSDGSCLAADVRQVSDLPSGNANLGPLADNGGPTPTHALLAGSQAIDTGDDAVCVAELVNGIDQRGVPRFQGAHCDLGAYESIPPVPANTLRIQALIDGRSRLIVHGNTVQWHHFDFAAPGRHLFANNPTIINDALWFPVWPDLPDAENRFCNCDSDIFTSAAPLLPTADSGIGLSVLRSRTDVQIVQLPTASNDYTLILEFNDYLSGSDTYILDLIWGQPQAHLFVSSHSSGRAGDVNFRDEDIVAYDFTTNSWQMVFDGSDVGVTKDVDAFAFRPDGTLLLSFNAPTNVPGLGQVDDSDIVQFTPTQLGSTTTGSFARYLRGADVGLTTDGEDVDAISFTANGHLIVSTIGDVNISTLFGKDEDLIRLDDAGSGAWSFFLNGWAVGLANEDVNGFWLDTATGERYLTVKDSFAFTDGDEEVQIDSDDIFVCTPTADGGCAYRRFWDSDSHDYGSENLDSIGLGALPASFIASVQASDTTSSTPDELAADDDSDDFNAEELVDKLFLPLVER